MFFHKNDSKTPMLDVTAKWYSFLEPGKKRSAFEKVLFNLVLDTHKMSTTFVTKALKSSNLFLVEFIFKKDNIVRS